MKLIVLLPLLGFLLNGLLGNRLGKRFVNIVGCGLPLAAFTLDWGEGRAAFDPEAAAARVAAALDEALAAEGLHAEPLLPTPDHNFEADHG